MALAATLLLACASARAPGRATDGRVSSATSGQPLAGPETTEARTGLGVASTPERGVATSTRDVGPESGAAPATPRGGPLHPVATAPPEMRIVARASIGAVGDVLMHGAVKDAAADHRRGDADGGFGWLWAPVKDLLSATDLTFANLETPVAPTSGSGSRSFVFNAPPAVVSALRSGGVKVVSFANNHVLDQGRPGFEETLGVLDRLAMPYVGAGPEGRESGPRVFEVNGLSLAFLGYARFFNQDGNDCPRPAERGGRPCVKSSLLDPERAAAEVRTAAARYDAVVVSLHWGTEYEQQPREADVALAHRLANAGALIVLGHHPHVLQPIELYQREDGRTALIAYSLGNFVSNQSRGYVHGVTPAEVGATRDGALVRVELVKRDYGRGVVRTEVGSAGYIPLWTENDTADPARRKHGARPSIQVVALNRALAEVRAGLSRLPSPVPAAQEARYVALRKDESLYLDRKAAIEAVLGEDLALPAPPAPARAEALALP